MAKTLIRLIAIVALIGASVARAQDETAAAPTPAAKIDETVFVAGATGRVGSRVVAQLKAKGYTIRPLTRDLEKAKSEVGEDYDWVVGDVTDIDTLRPAMQGVDKLVVTIGSGGQSPEAVDYGGVKNLVDVAKEAGVAYALLVSSGGVTHPEHRLNQMFDNLLIWKFKGEEHLRNSGLKYTVFRPGGLRDLWAPGDYGIVFMQGDLEVDGLLSLDDAASVIVECLTNPACENKTFEAFNYKALEPQNWRKNLNYLLAD